MGVGDDREAPCSPWGHKELDTTEQLNWTEIWNIWKAIKTKQDKPLLQKGKNIRTELELLHLLIEFVIIMQWLSWPLVIFLS